MGMQGSVSIFIDLPPRHMARAARSELHDDEGRQFALFTADEARQLRGKDENTHTPATVMVETTEATWTAVVTGSGRSQYRALALPPHRLSWASPRASAQMPWCWEPKPGHRLRHSAG